MQRRIFTQSELTTFKACRYKHFLKYEKGLSRPRMSLPALFGSAGHAGLEMYYKTGSESQAVSKIEEFFNDYKQTYLTAANSYSSVLEGWAKMRESMLTIFKNYTVAYPADRDPFMVGLGFEGFPNKMVEHPFKIPVITKKAQTSRLFDFAGKADLIAMHDGKLFVVDHKFKPKIDDTLQDSLRLSFQMRAYVLAEKIYTGLPIAGACWNVLLRKSPGKPSINKDGTVSLSKVDTTVDIYRKTLAQQDRFLRETKGKGLDYSKYEKEMQRLESIQWFRRFFCEYSDDELLSMQREIHETSMDIYSCSKRGAASFYKNSTFCDLYGKCEYRNLCLGIASGEGFDFSEDHHKELPDEIDRNRRWNGYVIDSHEGPNDLSTFEDGFEDVQTL